MSRFRPVPDLQTYQARRERILEKLAKDNAVLVLSCGLEKTRANDTHFRFRPNSNFHYLTGLAEPGAVLVLGGRASSSETVLFVRERDAMAEIWSGRRLGAQAAKERFGASQAYHLSELEAKLPELLDGAKFIYSDVHATEFSDPKLTQAIESSFYRLRRGDREGKICPAGLLDIGGLLHEDRLIKDSSALNSLRRAVDLSVAGHLAAMRATAPGVGEYELEAILEYEFRRTGGQGAGYGTIVAGGNNANILHYTDNEDPLRDGDLVLVDAGGEWDYFTGDITRTWPANGKFSARQRDVYQVVLAANEACIAKAKPGATLHGLHDVALVVLSQGLLDLGLVKGSLEEVLEKQLYKPSYMHRTNHWLGIDVHDVGSYCVDKIPRKLESGMVITVEPALYLDLNRDDLPEEFRGIGIRIEDDVLITADTPEVLSAGVPKQIQDIEAIVGTSVR